MQLPLVLILLNVAQANLISFLLVGDIYEATFPVLYRHACMRKTACVEFSDGLYYINCTSPCYRGTIISLEKCSVDSSRLVKKDQVIVYRDQSCCMLGGGYCAFTTSLRNGVCVPVASKNDNLFPRSLDLTQQCYDLCGNEVAVYTGAGTECICAKKQTRL